MPFSVEQFLDLFAQYNRAVWPLQLALIVLAAVTVALAFSAKEWASRVVAALLSMLWLWAGGVYHWLFFSRINRAAWLFGALFVAQAVVFLWLGVVKRALQFRFSPDRGGLGGLLCLAYALLLYPLLGQWQGHLFPRVPSFGTPCPVTIFTFGMLLWTTGRVRLFVLALPLLWSLIGAAAAFTLGMREDFALPAAGLFAVVLLAQRKRNWPQATPLFKEEKNYA